MKKVLIKITALSSILLLFGCTYAGPFVTNISSDGDGNLIIEKSYVKMNAFMGTLSNEGGTTTIIKLKDK